MTDSTGDPREPEQPSGLSAGSPTVAAALPSPAGHRVGDVVAGVRLTGHLGSGGNGTVWAGYDAAVGTRVALKLLDSPPAAAAEATLLRAAVHPHVLRVHRVSQQPPALVLDLATGGSLAALVRARGVLDPDEVVTLLAPLAGALAALRETGLSHGDVTAANVLFDDWGRPLLADLGAGRWLGTGQHSATAGFAAPEVLAGQPPGPAADVHGLGAVGWFALTGSPPGPAGDRFPLPLLSPDCLDPLAEILTAAVDPDPAGRPTAEELARAVHGATTASPIRLVPDAMPVLPAAEAVTHRVREAAALAPPPAARPRSWWRARRLRLWAAAIVVAVVAIGTGVVVGGGLAAATGDPPVRSGATETRSSEDRSAAAGSGGAGAAAGLSAGELESVVRELVAARGAALRSGDPAALSAVHAPGSAALAADRAALADGPLAVSYEVVSVDPAESTLAAAAGGVAAASGVTATGQEPVVVAVLTVRSTMAGDTGRLERVRVSLTSAGSGWLITAVER